MAYCIAQDLLDVYPLVHVAQLSGDVTGENADAARIAKAIEDYGDYMETFVRMQHPDNPFDSSHAFLRGINVEGAFLLLQKRNPVSPGVLDDALLQTERRLDGILTRIGSGEIRLMDDDEKADPPAGELVADEQQRYRTRIFGRAFAQSS